MPTHFDTFNSNHQYLHTMPELKIDYTQIKLQEQIPLSDAEVEALEKKIRNTNNMFKVLLMLFVLAVVIPIAISPRMLFFSYDVLYPTLFSFLIVFGLPPLLWHYNKQAISKLKKDIAIGKNVLTSILVYSRSTRNGGCYFIFAGRHNKEKIRLDGDIETYIQCKKEKLYIVHYIKYSRKILKVTDV